MFYLRTGTPGAGKTLSTIDELRLIKDRPIFYHGIPDLKLDWTLVSDPLTYHEQIPDGSIFVLDECQKHFPVRPPKDKTPDAISFIETHRHRGIDIYFITQHPSLLDHHARRLVGQHTHLQRNFGMPFAVKYTNNKLFDSTNYHELQTCEKSQYKYPKDVFQLYKSAETHTHKPRFPKKLLWLIPLLAGVGYGFFTVYSMLHKKDIDSIATQSIHEQLNEQSNIYPGSPPPQTKQVDWTTAFIPAVPGLPYTAPIYNKLVEPSVMPVLSGCVYSLATDKCQCYTQQATKVDMDATLCKMQVKAASFNPFKSDRRLDDTASREYYSKRDKI